MSNRKPLVIILIVAITVMTAIPALAQMGMRSDCGELRIGISEIPRSLAPEEILYSVEKQMAALVYESIYRLNKDNLPEAVLASYVDGSLGDDGKSCLLRMRSGSKWTTYEDITREDLIFSLNLNTHLDGLHRAGTSALIGAEAVGDGEIRLDFSDGQNAQSVKRLLTRIPIVSKDLYHGDYDANESDPSLRYRPTGSGWYMPSGNGIEDMVRSNTNSSTFMRADMRSQHVEPIEHPGDPNLFPVFPQIMYVAYPLAQQAWNALLLGAVDFVPDLPTSILNREHIGVRVESVPRGTRLSLVVNLTNEGHPALKSQRVREALCLAIDRRNHMKDLMGYDESNVDRYILSGPFLNHEFLADAEAVPRPFDPEAAKRLLHQDPQAVRSLEERPLRFVYTGGSQANDALKGLPSRIARDLEGLASGAGGVRIRVKLINQGMKDYLQYLRDNKDWDLALLEWDSDQNGGIQVARLFGSPYQDNSLNFGHYVNDQMDGLIASILSETQANDLAAYTKRAHRIVYEELPHIFLWELKSSVAYNDRLVVQRKHRDNYLGQIDTWDCMQGYQK